MQCPDLKSYPVVAAITGSARYARHFTLPAVLGLAMACQGNDPVAPPPEAELAGSETPQVSLRAVRADTAARLEFTEEISGIETRFFPTLERPLVDVLTTAFQRFGRALKANDLAGAAKALTGARGALETRDGRTSRS